MCDCDCDSNGDGDGDAVAPTGRPIDVQLTRGHRCATCRFLLYVWWYTMANHVFKPLVNAQF